LHVFADNVVRRSGQARVRILSGDLPWAGAVLRLGFFGRNVGLNIASASANRKTMLSEANHLKK